MGGLGRLAVPGLTLLTAVVTAVVVLRLDGVDLARLLTARDSVYGPVLWWVLLAPVPLTLTLALVPRTPWPWVVLSTLHLAVLVATAVRLRLLLPGWCGPALVAVVAVGVAGVVAALRPVRSAAVSTLWQRVATEGNGEHYAETYARRFADLEATGADVHGEARLIASLRPAPATVLDAGCGTGRVARRLAELGYDAQGCDVDASMIEVARRDAPGLTWHVADLATLDLPDRFDVVALAGNVIPFLEPGTLDDAVRRLAQHLAPDGVLVVGHGTDPAHLPEGCPVTSVTELDAAASAAGLVPGERWSGWDREPYAVDAGYVVATYRRAAGPGRAGESG